MRKAHVIVYAPRTVGDLLRRRIRVVTGISQIKRSAGALESSEYTSIRKLVRDHRQEPATDSANGGVPVGRRAGKETGQPRCPAERLQDMASRRKQP